VEDGCSAFSYGTRTSTTLSAQHFGAEPALRLRSVLGIFALLLASLSIGRCCRAEEKWERRCFL